MDDNELERLLTDLESDRAERKESIKPKDDICKAICAFANDLPNHQQPGVVFIGARNDGTCANLPITDQLLLDLANIRSDGNILPLPALQVQKRTLGGCELAVVQVEPAVGTPVRYRSRIYIRVGPSTRLASAEEERRLNEKRRFRDLPFDLRPFPSASLNDLDLEFFRRTYLPATLPAEILEQNQRTVEQQLVSLRFATPETPPQPTCLGILVLGQDPLQFVPGAYIQFIRFDGETLADPIKNEKRISGNLVDQLRRLDEILEINISTAVEVKAQPTEVRHPDYPLVALQQLSRNAILHRSYEETHAPVRINWFSDRVEILNPGNPYGQVTKQNFGQPGLADYRNPHLAEAMKNLGYIQRFGIGIQLARNALQENLNPPPEFCPADTNVAVIIRRKA